MDPSAGELAPLFGGLWFPLNWLCAGLLWILEQLYAVVGNAGCSVILLSVVVKLLLRPLARLAERWQSEVDAMHTRLDPEIRAIRARLRGAEQSHALLELHHRHGVSMFYGLKSALGLGLQIPMFLAAYHTLERAPLLEGQSFLWIGNLAQPDVVAALPLGLPLLGNQVRALPLLMLAVSLVASRLHAAPDLSPERTRTQRRGLYAMALGFFVLLYSLPAAMVLYWTCNGVVQLARELWRRSVPLLAPYLARGNQLPRGNQSSAPDNSY